MTMMHRAGQYETVSAQIQPHTESISNDQLRGTSPLIRDPPKTGQSQTAHHTPLLARQYQARTIRQCPQHRHSGGASGLAEKLARSALCQRTKPLAVGGLRRVGTSGPLL